MDVKITPLILNNMEEEGFPDGKFTTDTNAHESWH
jgi:hypothetical protein